MRKVSKKKFLSELLTSERGDTNFISIIIVLAIVAFVGAMFFAVVKEFMPQFFDQIKAFFGNVLGGTT